jgi:FemAB-related protein (PEP-CTERM system-associated)
MNKESSENGLEVLGPEDVNVEEWRRFVTNCPSATVYHLPEWSRILEKSFGYKSFTLWAKDKDNQIRGMLPLSLVKSPLTGSRLVSLPFSHICGPIGITTAGVVPLIEEAKRISRMLKCDHLEIRMMGNEAQSDGSSVWLQHGFEIDGQFSTYVLKLSSPEEVWKKLDSKSVRWAIRKAQKDGVIVKKTDSLSDIRLFYDLNLRTKRRLGVPGHPERLFIEMLRELGAQSQLYLAEFQNKVIAGIVTLKLNDWVLYAYGASDSNYRMHQPNDLLVWTAVEESCQLGHKVFDFGRVSSAERGLSMFKRHWGTEEKRLEYYYYPHVPKSMALNPHGMKYRLATSIWKKMPLPLARVGSNIIFRHIG